MSAAQRAAWVGVCSLGVILSLRITAAPNPVSQSEPLALELAALMGAQQLEVFAARDNGARDVFVAGRLFPRVQWLVVSGRPTAPSVVQAYLDRHEYGDVYGLLQSAVVPDTKWFVQDLRADGLHAEIADSVDILYERVVNQTIFDGEPGKHKMRAKDYARKFADADAEYARLLSLLLRSLRLMTSVNADARN
jgi:hypothetical protein